MVGEANRLPNSSTFSLAAARELGGCMDGELFLDW